jgi:hypothetical protein
LIIPKHYPLFVLSESPDVVGVLHLIVLDAWRLVENMGDIWQLGG